MGHSNRVAGTSASLGAKPSNSGGGHGSRTTSSPPVDIPKALKSMAMKRRLSSWTPATWSAMLHRSNRASQLACFTFWGCVVDTIHEPALAVLLARLGWSILCTGQGSHRRANALRPSPTGNIPTLESRREWEGLDDSSPYCTGVVLAQCSMSFAVAG